MSRRSLPLNAIDAFLVTARHLNLTHAAAELCLTQGGREPQDSLPRGLVWLSAF